MLKTWQWVFFLTMVVSLTGLRAGNVEAVALRKPALQGAGLFMVGPTACPSTGCAPGQRMNLRFGIELSTYFPSDTPNVKVCIYAPTSWDLTPDTNIVNGELTGNDYTVVPNCDEDGVQPSDYTLITAREASINQTAFSDSIPFAFRFATTASGKGQIVARLFERGETTPFTRTQQSTTTIITPAALASTVYVSTDAAACGSNAPCYLNSADDLANGLGTGLRDAVEAVAAGSTINILGTYLIKSNTVIIDKQLTVSGLSDATITNASSGACTQPVLSLRENVTLRNLNINDGACTSPGRSLVEVNSSKAVDITSNDL
ncbi:MAG: hypothetical protein IH586_10605, partial [Anaerolineaceae bacterium]|nr:hypothetical protein [Anaerolineaceae bacterium]